MKQYQCPVCSGYGGIKDVILDDGSGPFESCGFCGGKGAMDRKAFYKALGYQSWFKRRQKQTKHKEKNHVGKISV